MKAIAQSQALGKKVQEMPAGRDKESWQKECVDVSGLLAYVDLSICPVRGYLAQERREGLAELVNAAVLRKSIPASSLRTVLIGLSRMDGRDADAVVGAGGAAGGRRVGNARRVQGGLPARCAWSDEGERQEQEQGEFG